MNATVKTTGKFAPGLTFTKPSAEEIHEAQRNARPNHGKTIRHLTAWADEVERRNERLVETLRVLADGFDEEADSIDQRKRRQTIDAMRAASALLRELGEAA